MKLPLGTSGARAGILAVAVVVGVVVLANAFPSNASRNVIVRSSVGAAKHRNDRTTALPTSPPSPRVKGAVVQVLNGTNEVGLGALATAKLKKAGYSMQEPDNADEVTATIVYYSPGWRFDAQYLQTKFFPGGTIRQASLPADLNMRVVVGPDFADASDSA